MANFVGGGTMKTSLRAVEKGELIHPRDLARRIIRDRAKQQKGGLAEVHDPDRPDLDRNAPMLPVDEAVKSATYQIQESLYPK